MKPHFWAIACLLATVLCVTAAPAGAQTLDQRSAARAAAEAGGDAFDAGKYEEAADLFARAERLLHAPPHLLYGARSNAKLGRLVAARELYLALVRERMSEDAPRVFRDAQQAADKELAEVETRLPYVSVVVQGPGAKSVRVTRNDEQVPPELLGVPHPVDPGVHRYQAFADGMESTETTVQLKPSVRETVVLTLRRVAGAATTPAAAPTEKNAELRPPSTSADAAGGGLRPMVVGAIVSFGFAGAGAGLGIYFTLSGNADRDEVADDADALFNACDAPPRQCTPSEVQQIDDLDSRGSGKRAIGIGSFVAGGVGLVTGVTLLLLDSGRSNSASTGSIRPVIGLGYAGVSGKF